VGGRVGGKGRGSEESVKIGFERGVKGVKRGHMGS